MHRLLILIFFCSSSWGLAPKPNPVVAKVNGEKILEIELQEEINRKKDLSRAQALEKIIDTKLIVQQAKKEKLEKDPEIKREIERVLYQAFLSQKFGESKESAEPSDRETEERYAQWPYLRIKHLALLTRSPTEKEKAEKDVLAVQEKLKEGADFTKLVLAYSQVDSAKLGGDLDFRGLNSFSDDFVKHIRPLKRGEVAGPFESDGAIHFVQLVDVKSFAETPATYLQALRGQIRQEKREQLLKNLSSTLRKKSKIEMAGPQ